MRSGTSRGVPEWSGGKDLYMGSLILVAGKVLGFIGNVPGPPGGSRGSTKWGHRPGGLHVPSVGGDQPQVGWCALPTRPKAQARVGGGKP